MFQVTCLGHHCWLLSTGTTSILVDPLLGDRFGFTDSVELRVYPPRVFDFSEFPPVEAVFITHEHEGHVDIPSLHRLDRRTPVHLSARSSVATRKLVSEMGFPLRLAHPGVAIDVGDLHLLPMTADQVRHGVIEEWDVLPYLVWDRAQHGSFFSNVDMRANPEMWRLASRTIARPGLWCHTTNASVVDFAFCWDMPPARSLDAYVRKVMDDHGRLTEEWDAPAACMVVGGGWSFGGDQAWINRNHFPFENEQAAAILSALLPGDRVLAPQPGTRISMRDGAICGVEDTTRFVRAAPRSDWPSRTYVGDVDFLDAYTPATGRTALAESDVPALERELARFARHLYASDTFRRLYSLTAADLGGKKPTFALLLKADESDGAFVMEYEPQSCSFVSVDCNDPIGTYLAVYECWATDLLAHLRAEISPNAIGFGRHREWNANPEAFRFSLEDRLFEYMHQLRHPKRFLALYRRVLAAQPDVPLPIRAARRGKRAKVAENGHPSAARASSR